MIHRPLNFADRGNRFVTPSEKKMNPEKVEKLAAMAEQSASRIAREAMTFFCQAFSILKDDVINSQPEKALSQPTNEVGGNKSVTPPSRNLLTANEAAELLQVKVKTIYGWAESGKISSFKAGTCLRFDRWELLDSIRNDNQLLIQKAKPTLKKAKLTVVK